MALNTKAYRRPLAVYVVWHPDSAEGQGLASEIYRHLHHDPANMSYRRRGIPVFFRSVAADADSELPLPIPLDHHDPQTADRTAIFVLIDNKMLLDRELWRPYVDDLHKACEGEQSPHRLFLVALTSQAKKLKSKLEEFQFISASTENRTQSLLNRCTHELCRMLYDREPLQADESTHLPSRSVGVFLSHAKRDGLQIAEGIRDYISQNLSLRSFFDARDILPGSRWREVLREQASTCAVLAIQTDVYASRAWCQFEVLTAKQAGVPVVAINALQRGEPRSFPYAGNVPSIRWRPDEPTRFEDVLGLLFLEILRCVHFPARIAALRHLFGLKGEYHTMPYAPELLTALHLVSEVTANKTVIYPDPPLATGELELIRALRPELTLLTPTTLSLA